MDSSRCLLQTPPTSNVGTTDVAKESSSSPGASLESATSATPPAQQAADAPRPTTAAVALRPATSATTKPTSLRSAGGSAAAMPGATTRMQVSGAARAATSVASSRTPMARTAMGAQPGRAAVQTNYADEYARQAAVHTAHMPQATDSARQTATQTSMRVKPPPTAPTYLVILCLASPEALDLSMINPNYDMGASYKSISAHGIASFPPDFPGLAFLPPPIHSRGYTELGRQIHSITHQFEIKRGTSSLMCRLWHQRRHLPFWNIQSKHTKADREYLVSLSARHLINFKPRLLYWATTKFCIARASTTRSITISDPARVKIEAPLPSVVEAEPQTIRSPQASADIKMCTLVEKFLSPMQTILGGNTCTPAYWLEVERAVDREREKIHYYLLPSLLVQTIVHLPSIFACDRAFALLVLQQGGDAAIKPGWQVPDTSFWNVPSSRTNLAHPWKNVPRLKEYALHAAECAVHGMYLPSDFCWSRYTLCYSPSIYLPHTEYDLWTTRLEESEADVGWSWDGMLHYIVTCGRTSCRQLLTNSPRAPSPSLQFTVRLARSMQRSRMAARYLKSLNYPDDDRRSSSAEAYLTPNFWHVVRCSTVGSWASLLQLGFESMPKSATGRHSAAHTFTNSIVTGRSESLTGTKAQEQLIYK
ncbi:hypothetical protein C8J57DRAFT_1238471 [Mycena rebaudengoi]|nr:hypothetical protein C8J57DRAFT_1238471 [Mycena rebaudengoi]